MKNLLSSIIKGEIFVADGAIGSFLIEKGFKAEDSLEKLNLSNPLLLTEIAQLYLKSGAEIVQTNTFGASPIKLEMYSLKDKTEEINRQAVKAVRAGVKNNAYISASVGPCGKLLQPYGDIDPESVYDSFKIQIKVLAEAGSDIICIETMMDVEEMNIAVKAAKDVVGNDLPIVVSMTFNNTPKGFFTIMGTNIKAAVKKMELSGADIIGSNCGNGIDNMIKIAKEFKENTTLPIIIQSNAGLPLYNNEKISYPESPDFMAEKAKLLAGLGVNIIGGCCGTTEKHISKIRQAIKPKPLSN